MFVKKYNSAMLTSLFCSALVGLCTFFFRARLELFALDRPLFHVHESASPPKVHARDLIISIPKRAPCSVH